MSSFVNGVDFLAVRTKDFPAAREFYADVLGLPCSAVWRESDPVGAEYETGNLTIALVNSAALGLDFEPSKQAIALRVDDVEATRAQLESQGVAFHGETIDSGVCHQAFFSDPDGNALILHHRYAPRS